MVVSVVVLRRLEKAVLNLVFVNNRAILLIIFVSRIYRKCVRYSFVSPVYHKAHHGWVGNIFQHKGSQKAQNAIFRLVFTNAAFHKRAILLIFYAKLTESVLYIFLYPEPIMGLPR